MAWKLLQQSKNIKYSESNSEPILILTLIEVKQRIIGLALTYVGAVLIIYSTMLA